MSPVREGPTRFGTHADCPRYQHAKCGDSHGRDRVFHSRYTVKRNQFNTLLALFVAVVVVPIIVLLLLLVFLCWCDCVWISYTFAAVTVFSNISLAWPLVAFTFVIACSHSLSLGFIKLNQI